VAVIGTLRMNPDKYNIIFLAENESLEALV
jgi:hypothetical protein